MKNLLLYCLTFKDFSLFIDVSIASAQDLLAIIDIFHQVSIIHFNVIKEALSEASELTKNVEDKASKRQ